MFPPLVGWCPETMVFVCLEGFIILNFSLDLEDESNLDTTVTISTPDVVSSCEDSPQLLDSFGILDPADMEDFSNLTVSVEKLPNNMEMNRNIDETFDANSFPSRTQILLLFWARITIFLLLLFPNPVRRQVYFTLFSLPLDGGMFCQEDSRTLLINKFFIKANFCLPSPVLDPQNKKNPISVLYSNMRAANNFR